MSNPPPMRGWILYDGSCGVCSTWVPFWSATLRARGYDIAPLQSEWVRRKLALPDEVLYRDVRLLLTDGTQLRGADVYRHVMKQIWWAYPLALLASAPLLRRIFDIGYRVFANNRFRISRACKLDNPSQPSAHAPPDS